MKVRLIWGWAYSRYGGWSFRPKYWWPILLAQKIMRTKAMMGFLLGFYPTGFNSFNRGLHWNRYPMWKRK